MTLVDSSVWVDHLRRPNESLMALLEAGAVLCHPFVIGEISLGHLKQRSEILKGLSDLPKASLVTQGEALAVVERYQMFGRGLGWVDVHLLASALLDRAPLWTLDRRLAGVARELGVGWTRSL